MEVITSQCLKNTTMSGSVENFLKHVPSVPKPFAVIWDLSREEDEKRYEVGGEYEMSKLDGSAVGVTYEAAFTVTLEKPIKGAATLILEVPDGKRERRARLDGLPAGKVLTLPVGDFGATRHGKVKFTLIHVKEHEHEGKCGIVVPCATITPRPLVPNGGC